MLCVPLIALAQDKKDDKDREEKKEEAKEKTEDKKDEAKDKAEDAKDKGTTETTSSMPPGPIAARTGGRIDDAIPSNGSFRGSHRALRATASVSVWV